MKTNREQFEEIWPVPEGVYWNDCIGEYGPINGAYGTNARIEKCVEMDCRLDTFTRCQESQAIVTSLNDELVGVLEGMINAIDCDDLVARDESIGSDSGDHVYDVVKAARTVLAKARGQS